VTANHGEVSPQEYENIVVGGGISGAAATYYLSKSGKQCALIEQFDLNTQASGRNAGSLHGQIQYEAFHQLGEGWAREFLPALKFLNDSLEIWKGLTSELGVDLEVAQNGGLMIAESQDEFSTLARKVELERSVGIDAQLLSMTEVLEKAPYISKKMMGGAYSPIEGKANPLLGAPAFTAAARTFGTEVFTGVKVNEIERRGERYLLHTTAGDFICRNLIITANAGINFLAKSFGIKFPISDDPVQVSVSEIIAPMVKHLVYFTGEKLTFKQAKSGSLLIGGGWPAKIGSDGRPAFNPDSFRENMRVALKVVPSIHNIRIIRTWIGTGNGTPDHRPIIGEVANHKGLFIGMFPYMGFTAGPLMGRTLATLVAGGESDRDLSPFSMTRFG
jgi:sarcosine oxidase subunit beta